MIYETSEKQRIEVYRIAAKMQQAKLADPFIEGAVALARQYEGAYDLMVLWEDGDEQALADLQELMDEESELANSVVEKPKIPYADIEDVGATIVAFKKNLRDKVDRWGGIAKLARETGMPQPSLSRFFNTASMPRRTTLYKIAKAMALPETEIAFDWTA